MNLVSGKNGSGKSAIVHALQFCLGASARQTGRGAALKDFVRHGANSCRAAVTLWNTGAPPGNIRALRLRPPDVAPRSKNLCAAAPVLLCSRHALNHGCAPRALKALEPQAFAHQTRRRSQGVRALRRQVLLCGHKSTTQAPPPVGA